MQMIIVVLFIATKNLETTQMSFYGWMDSKKQHHKIRYYSANKKKWTTDSYNMDKS